MATAEQIKALIRSHFSDESEHFNTVALQIAASEARQGHTLLANDIRLMLTNEKQKKKQATNQSIVALDGLLLSETPKEGLSQLVVDSSLEARLRQTILEYRQMDKLKFHNLTPRRKLLLIGPSGTGKTMTSRILSHELRLPLFIVQTEGIVSKYLGETGAKLRQIFDLMKSQTGVYMFDEFDAIGSDRSLDNEIGEIRRVLNAFLQFIEQDVSDCIIIAATNNQQLLDKALYRRFDDILFYDLPNDSQRKILIKNILNAFADTAFAWDEAVADSAGLCHADIKLACLDSIKEAILTDQLSVNSTDLSKFFKFRKEGIQNK